MSFPDGLQLLHSTVSLVATGKVTYASETPVIEAALTPASRSTTLRCRTLTLDIVTREVQNCFGPPWTQSKTHNHHNNNLNNNINNKKTDNHLKNRRKTEKRGNTRKLVSHRAGLQACSSKVHCLLVRNDHGKHPSVVVLPVMTSDRCRHPWAKCRGAVCL